MKTPGPLLIIFIKNLQLGKVKTRLAASIGDQKALSFYQLLLQHTRQIIEPLDVGKIVYYSQFIEKNDDWPAASFKKATQSSGDLGNKMHQAFKAAFHKYTGPIAIIGSDCYDLTEEIMEQGFKLLGEKDVVIGPAEDGGYYFLGMKKLIPEIFEEMPWSTDKLLELTLAKLTNLNLSYALLPTLNDIDTLEDLQKIEDWEKLL